MSKEKAWARPIQEPVAKPGRMGAGSEGTEFSHPSFGTIGAFRTSGSKVLFNSDFKHQNYMVIKISGATLTRSLNSDWVHGRLDGSVEVAMSEAQWATFVSSPNIGSGVPCTIERWNGETVPGLPEPVDRREQFGAELMRRQERACEHLAQLETAIAASGLSQKKQAELASLAQAAARDIGSNSRFVAERFDEHMEETTERAKMEVNAYALAILHGEATPLQLAEQHRVDVIEADTTRGAR